MQEGETDVRLRHHNGKGSIQRQSVLGEFLAEDAHGMSHVVTASSQCIGVMYILENGAAQKVANDAGRLPTVGREADAQSLVVFQYIVK